MHSAGDKGHNAKHYTQHNDNHKRCHNNVRSKSERYGQILTVQPCTQQNQQHHNYVGDSHCVKHDRSPPLIKPRTEWARGYEIAALRLTERSNEYRRPRRRPCQLRHQARRPVQARVVPEFLCRLRTRFPHRSRNHSRC